jgi:3-isopropylmalate/(R)-2-methylmalate dehydratase small subunit
MEKFTKVTSLVAPYAAKDVDTDLIIPAQYLTSTSRDGYGHNLFRRLRDNDPAFFLNDKRFQSAKILAVGENFACGSSREHAVWALQGAGFKVVIGSSFADIFTANSAKNGLLLVRLKADEIEEILTRAVEGNLELTVDLEGQGVTLPDGKRFSFDYDPFRKTCLLEGLDDVDYLLAHRAEIDSYFDKQTRS